jgi:hypothetical protein
MHESYHRYLSGLGDAEDLVFGTDEEAGDAGTVSAPGSPSPNAPGEVEWETVLATTISALPEIAGKAAETYRTYEEARGHIPHSEPSVAMPGAATRAEAARPWYESPGFLVIAGLGLGVVVVIATRRK